MLEEQDLAGGVDVAALPALRVPGVANLDAVRRRDDVVVARAADHFAALRFDHRPRQHVARLLPGERGFDVRPGFLRLGHARVPELPQLAVLGGLDEALLVLARKRFEAHPVALQGRGFRLDHAAPLSKPSFLNMSRIPRTAWRRRCSFSMSAMRTWSSP